MMQSRTLKRIFKAAILAFSAVSLVTVNIAAAAGSRAAGTVDGEASLENREVYGRTTVHGPGSAYRNTSVHSDSGPVPRELERLIEAYPDLLAKAEDNCLVWKDGTRMPYDDRRKKTFEEMLDSADLEDQMHQRYPAGAPFSNPAVNFDPGRIRNEPFFRHMYGASRSEVKGRLAEVMWLPSSKKPIRLLVTMVNGIDTLLQSISNELDTIDDLRPYVDTPAGTFSYREIAGTSRLSMHSYGAAIDLNVTYSDYWRWKPVRGGDTLRCVNKIPPRLIGIFERRGFIWGGRWYHFDTMHFEYRPELFVERAPPRRPEGR